MHYVRSLTYVEGWHYHVKPALDRQKAPAAADVPEVGAQQIAIDLACKGKKYEGEKWWEPFIPNIERAIAEGR